MIEVNATLLTLLIEGLVLVSSVLLIGLIVRIRRKGRDRKALRALVASINDEAPARLQQTKTVIGDGDGAATLSKHERSVCEAFIRVYNKRAAESVSSIYAQLKLLVDAYQKELEGLRQNRSTGESTGEAETPKDRVISKLKTDYEEASRELEIANRTIEKMLREYSSMFVGGGGDEEEKDIETEASELLQRLQADTAAAAEGDEPPAEVEAVNA